MPSNPMSDDMGSKFFDRPSRAKGRRRPRDVPERDPGEKKQSEGPPVGYAKRDEDYWRILAIYGRQDESQNTRRRDDA